MNEMQKQNSRLNSEQSSFPILRFETIADEVLCLLSGNWTITSNVDLTDVNDCWHSFFEQSPSVKKIVFKVSEPIKWDSRLVAFLFCKKKFVTERNICCQFELPSDLERLFNINPAPGDLGKSDISLKNSIDFLAFFRTFQQVTNFLGAWVISLFSLLILRSQLRLKDIILICKDCGSSALPIVTLLSFLTGLTMAFVGSVQLEKFNARIYIADLVALAMVREMGALMVGIIMAGRTGAAFAAEIGNMKLNEELDSLRTFAISPLEFLVLPRTLALVAMVPMLTIYADIVGMLGGLTVGTLVMDFSPSHYIEQTQSAIRDMWEVYSGLVKSVFFGLVIGLVGCYKGLHTGNTSLALGKSVTSSVVTSVTFIVIFDALFEILFSAMELR